MAGVHITSEIVVETPISDRRLARLVEYWRSQRGGDDFPMLGYIDPLDFIYGWGYVCLVEVIHDCLSPRSQFRLYSSKLSDATGDGTGRFLDEISLPQRIAMSLEGYFGNVSERALLHHSRDLVCDCMPVFYEAVALPLQADGGVVKRLLIGVIPGFSDDPIAGSGGDKFGLSAAAALSKKLGVS